MIPLIRYEGRAAERWKESCVPEDAAEMPRLRLGHYDGWLELSNQSDGVWNVDVLAEGRGSVLIDVNDPDSKIVVSREPRDKIPDPKPSLM